jgi:hypothetical protein
VAKTAKSNDSDSLNGWQQIGIPESAQRCATETGWPRNAVEKRGRYVYSSREELNRWLGRESAGEPVQIATQSADLAADLRRGLTYAREHSPVRKKKRTA